MQAIIYRIILISFILSGMLWTIPQSSYAQSTPNVLETLPSCRFNAYTDRDDLIIGAVVLNFETGNGCTQNLNSAFPVASVGKLFVLGAFYEDVAQGRYNFDQEMLFSDYYLMNGRSACLTVDDIGYVFTVGYLANIMISCSDNASTWMMMDFIGWERVQAYIDSLGIEGIGEVIPYSEVDRLKLTLIDERWAEVPRSLASQFLRRRYTEFLSPTYFPSPPRYDSQTLREANQTYLETYTYNTATPRALAEYMLLLRNNLQNGTAIERQTAQWIFNTMLLTQRQYSTQDMPGTLYVGSKNGYDVGYRAEVNVMIRNFETYNPESMNIVIVKHRNVSSRGVSSRFTDVATTDFLLTVSPIITGMLYPAHNPSFFPAVVQDVRVRDVVLNENLTLFPCYENFLNYDYLDGLQRCWANINSIDRTDGSDLLGVGMILRDLYQEDVRITMIWYPPEGHPRAYQMQRFNRSTTAMAWFEDVNVTGLWRVDVFYNLQPIFSQNFFVNSSS